MSLKIMFIVTFGIIFFLLSNYVTTQISQLQAYSALMIAFLIDIVIYLITAVLAAFFVQPKGAKTNGRIMLWIVTVFLVLHLSLNNTWEWILSWEYLLILAVSYALAFLMGKLGFKLLDPKYDKEPAPKSIIKSKKRITKAKGTTKSSKKVKRAQKKKTAKKTSKKTYRKSAQ